MLVYDEISDSTADNKKRQKTQQTQLTQNTYKNKQGFIVYLVARSFSVCYHARLARRAVFCAPTGVPPPSLAVLATVLALLTTHY